MTASDRAKWETRWQRRHLERGSPEPFVVRHLAGGEGGAVLDVAAGNGRNALWLAQAGYAVTAIDISATAVAALQRAAAARELTLATRVADLDVAPALDGLGPFDAVVITCYRPAPGSWSALAGALRPGGRLLLCSFGRTQHERHGFPLAFCLDRGEIEAEIGDLLRLQAWSSQQDGDRHLEWAVWLKSGA